MEIKLLTPHFALEPALPLPLRDDMLRPSTYSSGIRSPLRRRRITVRCLSANLNASKENPTSSKLITKKKYSDLPERQILTNGDFAPALSSWSGGLQAKQEYDKAELNTECALNAVLPTKISVTKRRRSTKTVPADGCIAEIPVKKRNSRTIKSATVATAKISEATTTSLSDNANTKKKSNRRMTTLLHAIEETEDDQRINTRARTRTVTEDDPGPPPLNMQRQPRNQLAGEILGNLRRFPHCILLTRVGQFYESYFDQAQEVSRLLSIKLTQRTWDGQRIWMCGFPIMHLDKHLKTLVQQHKRPVALCEEFMRPRESVNIKPVFDRRVVRVLTPGTLIDETFVNPYENNYLLAISHSTGYDMNNRQRTDSLGLAWMDVSTGELFTQTCPLDGLHDHLARISPREVILDRYFESNPSHPILDALSGEGCYISFFSSSPSSGIRNFPDATPTDNIVENPLTPTLTAESAFTDLETSSMALLTSFLQANLLEHFPSRLSPSREGFESRMQIDGHTIKALEIREAMIEGGSTGSLMSVVKRTITSSGTRLLSRWLCSPSTSIDEITARQSLVRLFFTRESFRNDILEHLNNLEDASRIVQKFLLGRGDPDDLSAIRHTIEEWNRVKSRISLEKVMEATERQSFRQTDWPAMDALMVRLVDMRDLANRISFAVADKGKPRSPISGDAEETSDEQTMSDGQSDITQKINDVSGSAMEWTITPQYSPELTALHDQLRILRAEKDMLQEEFQRQFDAPSLTLRSSPSLGIHVHIAKPRRDLDRLKRSQRFVAISESNSTKSFFNQEWFKLGSSIVETMGAIVAAEKEAFTSLRKEVSAHAGAIRRNARIFDELDVTLAFARVAEEFNFTEPSITAEKTYRVVNGRHPTVELGLMTAGRMFTPNSISLCPSSRLHIITGPNMAGKSTFLRQVALIAILAQTGSFVPADSAEIGVVDRVFSRVGAKDDLFRDRSTFMVEMLETAEILKRATDRSLVIMDEVGRGTTVKDGLAIAFATIHHLYFTNRCRALFATHFHEVTDMLGYRATKTTSAFPDIDFFCTDVDETKDGLLAYSHALRPGVNRDSHGLKVAQLGGMPHSALAVAQDALAWIKKHSDGWVGGNADLQALGERLAEGRER
ncbi:hypothetical protein BD410DRAFT_893532 [Rickenella mellea]|uniref:DNA mismatch repair proteins mutS family domain-containing protein n=1 Tax=Rickenella mellea TaxID=50990 RepID=A0A4Y7QMR4_9AGAM|nr:hypothetical protein BD410DRAFT_893532 [Rickenella mellea]